MIGVWSKKKTMHLRHILRLWWRGELSIIWEIPSLKIRYYVEVALNVFVTSYYLLQLSITWGFKFIFRGLRKPFQQIGSRQLTTLKGQFRDHWSHHWSDSFMTPRVSGRGDSFGEETIADFSLLNATLSFCLIGNFLLRDVECTRLIDARIVSKT